MTEWSKFELNGWRFVAFMPDNEIETQQWLVHIIDPKGTEHSLYVPMDYEPRFGPDAGDVDALSAAVESFIKERGIE